MTDILPVPRAHFRLDAPWRPLGGEGVTFRRSTDGSAPRLATRLFPWHDATSLYLLFVADDDAVAATYLERDQPLYEEDVFEAFLAPLDRHAYFEIEVNPLGTLFDARIISPDGHRGTMKSDLAWDCDGLQAMLRRSWRKGALERAETLLMIPFASLGRPAPVAGEEWFANFYRIDRAPAGDEFTAWRPTLRTPPDFHLPASFGRLVFD